METVEVAGDGDGRATTTGESLNKRWRRSSDNRRQSKLWEVAGDGDGHYRRRGRRWWRLPETGTEMVEATGYRRRSDSNEKAKPPPPSYFPSIGLHRTEPGTPLCYRADEDDLLNSFKTWVIVSILSLSQLSATSVVSPSGKLVQIEHALTAVGSGQTSLGIKAANGVVIATEKKLPSILVDESSVQKIQILTPNIGVVYSGMGPDSRVLVRKSRKQAEQYNRLYKEPIPVTQLVKETAAVMQEFTQSGGVRPFGVSLLVAGFDDKGPQLYQVDPSGSYFSWKASAMGKNVSNAKTFLEKRYTDDMELDDAVHTAILTLKEGFEGQISGKNIEIGIIGADKTFRVLTPAEVEDYLQEVE
ncbi:Proteasome A-type subunit [Cynara cardunculus var. scolymus]|uniref:Proteasome A-type subunit n=1 Tax=Cynara cardunculus var. scolymus TaxID=59895 RepID=A0A118JWG0_CYNCS|nr:Proteasome A-type subunit [Cynara cardunculus var. scolymus]